MSGIYIHIPFCKQACHYCDFHFSTTLTKKKEMILALSKELILRKNEFEFGEIQTIYFGGGTPSLLEISDIEFLIATIYEHFTVIKNPEITIEANPDDLSESKIILLSKTRINRLSIGIQSFDNKNLTLMNRAHNTNEAKKCLQIATQYFKNISVDLIYGIPGLSNVIWKKNIQTVLDFGINHLSTYALTVEPKTALFFQIKKGTVAKPNDEVAAKQFSILVAMLEKEGFIQYELSNFGKENFFSKNNSAYWTGKKYLGIGPSAHSFDGRSRSWNINNNLLYIKSIENEIIPNDVEILTPTDLYNEYVMTGLRTIWGVCFQKISIEFGINFLEYLQARAQKFVDEGLLTIENDVLKTTFKGKFLTDGIAADLFLVNLNRQLSKNEI